MKDFSLLDKTDLLLDCFISFVRAVLGWHSAGAHCLVCTNPPQQAEQGCQR